MLVNGVDYSGHSQLFASLWSKVRDGVPRRTVTVGSPIFERHPGEEVRLLRYLFESGSEGNLLFVWKEDLRPHEIYETAFPTTWETSSGLFKTGIMVRINLCCLDSLKAR
jgi:hypothetical protein